MRIAWRKRISDSDITYSRGLLFCLTLLEAQLGIVLASVPAIQPAIRRIMGMLSRRQPYKEGTPKVSSYVDSEGQLMVSRAQDGSDSDSVRPLGKPMMARSNSTIKSGGHRPSPEGVICITQTWDIHESNIDLPGVMDKPLVRPKSQWG